MAKPPKSPVRVGNNVLICTVTKYYTGKIEAISKDEILISSAAWIPDTGRFNEAVREGTAKLAEVEPYVGIVSVSRGPISDVSDWPGDLPIKVQ